MDEDGDTERVRRRLGGREDGRRKRGLGRQNERKEEVSGEKEDAYKKMKERRWRHGKDNELSHCSSDVKCMLGFNDHRRKHDLCIHLQKNILLHIR